LRQCCRIRVSIAHRKLWVRRTNIQLVTDDSIEAYLRPFLRTDQRIRDLERFLAAFDNKHTLAIEARLKKLKAPTLIVWGTDDVYFDIKWSHWLADTIPGTRRRVELKGARIFFPEERWEDFDNELRAHWQVAEHEALAVLAAESH